MQRYITESHNPAASTGRAATIGHISHHTSRCGEVHNCKDFAPEAADVEYVPCVRCRVHSHAGSGPSQHHTLVAAGLIRRAAQCHAAMAVRTSNVAVTSWW